MMASSTAMVKQHAVFVSFGREVVLLAGCDYHELLQQGNSVYQTGKHKPRPKLGSSVDVLVFCVGIASYSWNHVLQSTCVLDLSLGWCLSLDPHRTLPSPTPKLSCFIASSFTSSHRAVMTDAPMMRQPLYNACCRVSQHVIAVQRLSG